MIGVVEGFEIVVGVMVIDVLDGFVKDVGIEFGDVILIFDGIDVEDVCGLVCIVGNMVVGKVVCVIVLCGGKI